MKELRLGYTKVKVHPSSFERTLDVSSCISLKTLPKLPVPAKLYNLVKNYKYYIVFKVSSYILQESFSFLKRLNVAPSPACQSLGAFQGSIN